MRDKPRIAGTESNCDALIRDKPKVVSLANSNVQQNPYDEGFLERCVDNLKVGRLRL